jgi:PAS domain-containing protein
VAVVGISALLTLLATRADELLPAIMAGNGYTPALKFVVGAVWVLSLTALLIVIANRPYSALDLWLIVVMVAWLFDIALSAVLNAGRFDLGFYAGRFFGMLATSFVLAVILIEAGWLHAGLAVAKVQLESRARDLDARVRQRTDELVRANRRLGAILEASPVAILMLDPDGIVLLWTASAKTLGILRPASADCRLSRQRT